MILPNNVKIIKWRFRQIFWLSQKKINFKRNTTIVKKYNTKQHNMLIFTTMKIAEPIPDRLKRHSVSQIGHKGIAKM